MNAASYAALPVEAKRALALAWREDDESIPSIAERLGHSHSTISRWVTPGQAEKNRQYQSRKYRRMVQARAAAASRPPQIPAVVTQIRNRHRAYEQRGVEPFCSCPEPAGCRWHDRWLQRGPTCVYCTKPVLKGK